VKERDGAVSWDTLVVLVLNKKEIERKKRVPVSSTFTSSSEEASFGRGVGGAYCELRNLRCGQRASRHDYRYWRSICILKLYELAWEILLDA
jgi:hypothetical protein